MAVSLVWITPKAEETISYCARVSSDNQSNTEYKKLLKYCADNGHWSVFEMASMCVEITTSRAIAQQILRHRSFHFQEFSQRYAKATDYILCGARRQDVKNRQNSIDDLSNAVKANWIRVQMELWDRAKEAYKLALEQGIAKECARMILPLQTKTTMYMAGTIRDWIHYIKLRTDGSTQLEHKEVAGAIKQIMSRELPTISNAVF